MFLKVHRSLVYLLKKVLKQNQDAGEADAIPVSKLTQRRFFGPHTDSGFCGLTTQNTAKIILDWLKPNLMDHCPRKSGLSAQN
jgi:hypothetical protein